MFTYYTVAPYDIMITADFTGDVEARPVVVEYGDDLTLNCTASGGPNNTFLWYKLGDYYYHQENNTVNITTVNATDGGIYICDVSNIVDYNYTEIAIYGRSCL